MMTSLPKPAPFTECEMTIYRHKKTKQLYKIYRIFGRYLGATYTAEPLHDPGLLTWLVVGLPSFIYNAKLDDFEAVAER